MAISDQAWIRDCPYCSQLEAESEATQLSRSLELALIDVILHSAVGKSHVAPFVSAPRCLLKQRHHVDWGYTGRLETHISNTAEVDQRTDRKETAF
jgi:hypothetical protein